MSETYRLYSLIINFYIYELLSQRLTAPIDEGIVAPIASRRAALIEDNVDDAQAAAAAADDDDFDDGSVAYVCVFVSCVCV